MALLVDADVLLDILIPDPVWESWSAGQLTAALQAGPVTVNPVICAEIAPAFRVDWAAMDRWLRPRCFIRSALPWESSVLAAQAFATYRMRGGSKSAPLPDFFIGAHAEAARLSLLTRDAQRYQTYFPAVSLICP